MAVYRQVFLFASILAATSAIQVSADDVVALVDGEAKLLEKTRLFYKNLRQGATGPCEFDFVLFERGIYNVDYVLGHVELAFPAARIVYRKSTEDVSAVANDSPLSRDQEYGEVTYSKSQVLLHQQSESAAALYPSTYLRGFDAQLRVLPWQLWAEYFPKRSISERLESLLGDEGTVRIRREDGQMYSISKGVGGVTLFRASERFSGAVVYVETKENDVELEARYTYVKTADGTVYVKRIRGFYRSAHGNAEWGVDISNFAKSTLRPSDDRFLIDTESLPRGTRIGTYSSDGRLTESRIIGNQGE